MNLDKRIAQEGQAYGGPARWPISRFILWALPSAFLLAFFFYPLVKIFALTFEAQALTAQENLQIVWRVTRFTFYQAALSTLLTLALGLPAAFLFARFNFWGKSFLRALTAIPFMLPTVVVAAAFNSILQLPVFSALRQPAPLTLILLAHVFYNATIVIRILGAALAQLDPKLEQVSRSLGANGAQVWHEILLPLLKPALLSAVLLIFILDFTSFGVILLLGGGKVSTLEVEIYLRVLKLPNLPLAALLAILQLVFTLIFSILYAQALRRSSHPTAPRFSIARPPQTLREKIFVGVFSILLLSFFSLPLISLPFRSVLRLEADRGDRAQVQIGLTTEYYQELFINRRNALFYVPPIQAAINSIVIASLTVLFSLALGIPTAWALAKPTNLEKILDPLIMLPLGSSAVMLGLGLILTYGRALASPIFIPIAHTLIALPFVIRALQPAIASIPERLRQSASVLGASPWRVWRLIDFPILRRAALTAATFAFTISLGEFGATLLLSRPELPTIPVAIARFLSQAGGLNYGQAMAMSTILMALTLAGILLLEKDHHA
ncbi:MAG: iron ABC transporter permease [Anaerolineales bacterium]|nr:iron ABC transporter permease [Anaerolineales bacterium]